MGRPEQAAHRIVTLEKYEVLQGNLLKAGPDVLKHKSVDVILCDVNQLIKIHLVSKCNHHLLLISHSMAFYKGRLCFTGS